MLWLVNSYGEEIVLDTCRKNTSFTGVFHLTKQKQSANLNKNGLKEMMKESFADLKNLNSNLNLKISPIANFAF